MIKLPEEYCQEIQSFVDALNNFSTDHGKDNSLISAVRDGDIVVCFDPKAANKMRHRLEVNGKNRVRVTYFGNDNTKGLKTRGKVHFDKLALYSYMTRHIIDAERYLMDTKRSLIISPDPTPETG